MGTSDPPNTDDKNANGPREHQPGPLEKFVRGGFERGEAFFKKHWIISGILSLVLSGAIFMFHQSLEFVAHKILEFGYAMVDPENPIKPTTPPSEKADADPQPASPNAASDTACLPEKAPAQVLKELDAMPVAARADRFKRVYEGKPICATWEGKVIDRPSKDERTGEWIVPLSQGVTLRTTQSFFSTIPVNLRFLYSGKLAAYLDPDALIVSAGQFAGFKPIAPRTSEKTDDAQRKRLAWQPQLRARGRFLNEGKL
jgi:hypothetical protein